MGCDRCPVIDDRRFYATVDGVRYCSDCWRRAGRPWPRRPASPEEIAQAEITARGHVLDRRPPKADPTARRRR